MSTKLHQLVDGNGLPPVTLITPGQAGDSPMLLLLQQWRDLAIRYDCEDDQVPPGARV